MLISVIIPAFNPGPEFRECLAGLSDSGYRVLEVLVVDDCSHPNISVDNTPLPLKVIRSETPVGPGVARNIGAGAAQGDILLFIDSDIVIKSDVISKIVERFKKDKNVAAISGFYKFDKRYDNYSTLYHGAYFEYKHESIPEEGTFVDTAIWAIRKNIFDSTVGFPDGMFTSEDLEYGITLYRKGYKLCADRRIQGIHIKSITFKGWVKNRFLCCANMVMARLKRESGESEKVAGAKESVFQTINFSQIISPFVAWGIVLCLAINFLTDLPFMVAGTIIILFLYIIINFRYAAFIVSKHGLRGLFLLSFIVCEHLITPGAILFGLMRTLRRQPSFIYRGAGK